MSKWDLVNELHRQARRNFVRRPTLMRGIDDTLQADLVEMIPYASQNNGMKYILTVINIFSKKGYARPVKNKSAPEVTKAMVSILDSLGYQVNYIHVDQGSEFYNKTMQDMLDRRKIKLYSTFSRMKASIVERWNRTLKGKMWRMFSMQGSYKWLELLPKLVAEYNGTYHRTIKMKPNDVNKAVERDLLNTVYQSPIPSKVKSKFRVGQFVRISKYKHVFEKGYTPNWTTEIFKIKRLQQTTPITYLLIDLNGQDISGAFYAEELQSVRDPKLYLVEKIIKSKGDEVYVKWLGFNSSHNSWIKRTNLMD